jgi:hypothetical protein
MLRKWLDKLLGRSSDLSDTDEAQAEAAIENARVDRAGSRVMGVYGDIGSTTPDAKTPEDRRPSD